MIVVRRGRARAVRRQSSDIDEIVRTLMSGNRSGGARSLQVWRPALDVYSTDTSLEVVAELSGLRGEDIEVVVEGDVLAIRGIRERPVTDHCLSYYEARIPYGPFQADVLIPFEVDLDDVAADYENGLLTITLPRRRARTVEVRDSGSSVEESETHA